VFDLPFLDKVINVGLIREPLNWAIVFIFASISLLGFHTAMQAFTAMQGGGQSSFNSPGQIAIASSPVAFAGPGQLANSAAPDGLSRWTGGGLAGGDGLWTDGVEAKYAEDGWTGNP
jgi:hypothetical protein